MAKTLREIRCEEDVVRNTLLERRCGKDVVRKSFEKYVVIKTL